MSFLWCYYYPLLTSFWTRQSPVLETLSLVYANASCSVKIVNALCNFKNSGEIIFFDGDNAMVSGIRTSSGFVGYGEWKQGCVVLLGTSSCTFINYGTVNSLCNNQQIPNSYLLHRCWKNVFSLCRHPIQETEEISHFRQPSIYQSRLVVEVTVPCTFHD